MLSGLRRGGDCGFRCSDPWNGVLVYVVEAKGLLAGLVVRLREFGKSLLRFLNGSFLSSGTGGSTEVFFARGQFLWMRGAVSVGLYDSAAFSQ